MLYCSVHISLQNGILPRKKDLRLNKLNFFKVGWWTENYLEVLFTLSSDSIDFTTFAIVHSFQTL